VLQTKLKTYQARGGKERWREGRPRKEREI